MPGVVPSQNHLFYFQGICRSRLRKRVSRDLPRTRSPAVPCSFLVFGHESLRGLVRLLGNRPSEHFTRSSTGFPVPFEANVATVSTHAPTSPSTFEDGIAFSLRTRPSMGRTPQGQDLKEVSCAANSRARLTGTNGRGVNCSVCPITSSYAAGYTPSTFTRSATSPRWRKALRAASSSPRRMST